MVFVLGRLECTSNLFLAYTVIASVQKYETFHAKCNVHDYLLVINPTQSYFYIPFVKHVWDMCIFCFSKLREILKL